MAKIAIILALLSGILGSPHSRGRTVCDRKKSEIIRGIKRKDKETLSNFKINENGEPERICGDGYELTKDVFFCLDVCLLKTGDTCSKEVEAGVDLCGRDRDGNELECAGDDFRPDLPFTCQPMILYDGSIFDSSFSSVYFSY